MRKLSTLLISFLVVTFAFGKSVTFEKAGQVANNYFGLYSGKANHTVANSFSKSLDGITTYYVFNYTGGGFVVVSADDAAIPVLAQSNEGFVENIITNPATKMMFDNYSEEIAYLVKTGADNSQSLPEWNAILNNNMDAPAAEVAPLLTTTWDQGSWYNYYCPVAAGGPSGKAWAGCVATAMGQVMKFWNFPAQGVGSHSYNLSGFPTQSADFGSTNYNFPAMGNAATSASYQEIATLLYHAGVSVNMGYAADGSGAYSTDVPWALGTYFNYDFKTVKYEPKSSYTTTTWSNLLKAELDAGRPVYYSGSTAANAGHAWVCDGWRVSDGKFHMNWGWSGSSNGYFATTSMVVPGYTFSTNFACVRGIKPGNPNLIVRFLNLNESNSVTYGPVFDVSCQVVKGSPSVVKLYVDGQVKYVTNTATSFTYHWNTAAAGLGTHKFRVEAVSGTDTAFHEVNLGLSEWITQNSGFTAASRGIKYIHAVDQNLAWATAYDGASTTNYIQEFTKTTNGGTTWTPGVINNCTGMEPGMIFGIDEYNAYCPMYRQSGANPQGIYVTTDGGSTWTQQTSALFTNANSFPNVVHFFNQNDGFCMGDPINGDFEIYTTSNGGSSWTAVPGANITNPVTGEFGVVGYYDAVGDKAWFGTNMGRVYRTTDKGLNWTASATTLGSAIYTDLRFRDALHGLAQDKSAASTGTLSETSDGGVTWTAVTTVGLVGTHTLSFVPGTDNTWVSTEGNSAAATKGAFYSFDGGHSWASAKGTEAIQYLALDFVNNQCGWAGGFNVSATDGGFFKYVGTLVPILSPVMNLQASTVLRTVNLSWTAPATPPLSYNIYRNDVLLTSTTNINYSDLNVANGQQEYCVEAVYASGMAAKVCVLAWITVGVKPTDEAAFRVYPNPATTVINVVAPLKFNEVRIVNNMGQVVYRNNNEGTNLRILTEGFDAGIYILQIYSGNQVVSKKISISK